MAMGLTRGGESRLDGAPRGDLPAYADWVEAERIRLRSNPAYEFASDEEIDALARQYVDDNMTGIESQEAGRRAGLDARTAQRTAGRQQRQAAARGVSPESLPADAYGAVSGRTVQESNRPLPEAEAQFDMEQDAANAVIRDLREGRAPFAAQGDLDFLRERGDQNPLEPSGRTDMAMRDRIRGRRGQGFEMPDGTVIPTGREPTAAEIRAEREWQEWANQTPGTERQALYDPEAYEQHREGVRQDIQDRARADEAKYGTGSDAQLKDSIERGNRAASAQYEARKDRRASEDRVADSQSEVRLQQMARRAGVSMAQARQMMASGGAAAAGGAAAVPTADQRIAASQGLRDLGADRRNAELNARRQSRIDQAQMAGGQPTGGPFGTRATTTAINQLGPGWREIALLDRLTNGRVGGPTPLGVEQFQAKTSADMATRAFTAALANMDPNAQANQQMANQLQLAQMPPEVKVQFSLQRGEPMGTGYSAAHVGSRWNHWTYNVGPRPESWRLGNFRAEMEGLGYQPAEIDAFIDARMNAADAEAPTVPGDPSAGLPPAGGRLPL